LWINTPSITLETQYYPDALVIPYLGGRELAGGTFINNVTLSEDVATPEQGTASLIEIQGAPFVLVPTERGRILYAVPSTAAESHDEPDSAQPAPLPNGTYAQWATNPVDITARLLGMPLRPPNDQ